VSGWSWHERNRAAGTRIEPFEVFDGFTVLAEFRDGRWQFRNAH
jgi:hypothetical protein